MLFGVMQRMANWLSYLSAAAGIVMCALIVLSAIMRYAIGAPFHFTEEIVGLLFSALVFVLLPVAEVDNSHIKVSVLYDLAGGRVRRVLRFISRVSVAVFSGWFGLLSFDFAALSYDLRSTTEMGGIMLYPWMALMPLATGLLCLAAILKPMAQGFTSPTSLGGK